MNSDVSLSDAPAPLVRCSWALASPLMADYHDQEWGVPVHDDQKHYEYLLLDSAQAGLSWSSILNRREGYREIFAGFDPRIVAAWGPSETEAALVSPLIIRNRAKVESSVRNAQAFLRVVEEFGSFDSYVWSFVGGHTILNSWVDEHQIPSESEESRRLSRDLKSRGFSFVGPTIVYAVMQSAGLVNDHVVGCFRYGELTAGN